MTTNERLHPAGRCRLIACHTHKPNSHMPTDTASPSASRSDWSIPSDVTYLNHGSFGPSPRVVQEVREEWSRRLNANPMEFFLRTMEPALDEAAARLGQLVGADARDLVFVENATVAMNVVAESLPLVPGDEILLNDHEYGAVFRIWRSVCERTGAKIVSPTLGRCDVTRAESSVANCAHRQPASFNRVGTKSRDRGGSRMPWLTSSSRSSRRSLRARR